MDALSSAPRSTPAISIRRFSTCPLASTSTASARVGSRGTKLICASLRSAVGTSTIPAAPDRSDSMALAASSRCSRGPGSPSRASIARRSSALGWVICIIPSTNSRNPLSVGLRPAETCGAASRPSFSRSASTDRMEAGDRSTAPPCASVFDPIGCPVARYCSTTRRKISRVRSVSSVSGGVFIKAKSGRSSEAMQSSRCHPPSGLTMAV